MPVERGKTGIIAGFARTKQALNRNRAFQQACDHPRLGLRQRTRLLDFDHIADLSPSLLSLCAWYLLERTMILLYIACLTRRSTITVTVFSIGH
jgi:hypothetical protein